MIRKFALVAPLILAGLAACDRPAALTKAQPGDCFAVTGREKNGAPKWEKTACAPGQEAGLPAAETATAGATGTQTAAATGAPACPTQPVSCPPTATAASGSRHYVSARHGKKAKSLFRRGSGKSSLETAVEEREYARVPQEPQVLLGGDDSYRYEERHDYDYRSVPQPPAPFPPPIQHRYEHREYSNGYGSDDRRWSYPPPANLPPPPPPPPKHGEDKGYDRSGSQSYENYGSRRYGAKGHGSAHGYAQGGSSQSYASGQYSSRDYESRSYQSYSSGGSSSYRGPCCQTNRGNMAPMNGPHFPVDQDGYLTWRGKTPGY